MKFRRLGQQLSLLLAAPAWWACQGQTSPEQVGRVAAPVPARTKARPTASPQAAFTGYHRYVGTVGKLPAVLELTIPAAGSAEPLSGAYYYERRGQELLLSAPAKYQPGQPLLLNEGWPKPDNPAETVPTGRWRAAQPAGPVLNGTWESADGRHRLPFALREDYTGAVRYELLRETATGAPCPPAAEEEVPHPRPPEVGRVFLHLLGPDTLQPALRPLQCPLPEQRRNQLAVELDALDCESTFGQYGFVMVVLNGYGLLGLQLDESEDTGGAYPNNQQELQTFDLMTGKQVHTADWLRPGQEKALQRLLTRYLRASPYAEGLIPGGEDGSQLVSLPEEFGLNSEGAYCLLGSFGAPHVIQQVPIVIPYRELRAVVRPGSAVARMLQQRGLW
ncbi:hypothetical protein [Hymenobacter sp. CRA2]|uniref:hypothetical protein n=1 Tax=Hymenobacter sp. CRA2 TaxID=1955620 RepID=UPI00098EC43E|nr:hypothetical protein [Hymenobacter sp. CRA2]OON70063.1 hypothetical protein B0919_04775 [Hymenobacter sp. CRA2]